MRVGLVWTHISLKQARGFTASVLVFRINMKQNHWVSLTVLAGGQFRKQKRKKSISLISFYSFFSLHRIISFFFFLPLTFCLFCYSHLSASISVCVCKFMLCVCVWSTDRVIWLLDKQHTQALTASSIRMSVWWTGPVEGSDSIHASVYFCVWSNINTVK